MDEESDSYIWTTSPLSSSNELHSSLQEFESSLRCPICKGFFVNPVLITSPNCNHTFCSECIRTHFRNGRRSSAKGSSSVYCPTCRAVTDERKLVPNRLIEECTPRWNMMRKGLLGAIVEHDVFQKQNNHDDDHDLSSDNNKNTVNNCNNSKTKSKRKSTSNEKKKENLGASKRSRRSTRNQANTYNEDYNDDDEADSEGIEEDKDEAYNPIRTKTTLKKIVKPLPKINTNTCSRATPNVQLRQKAPVMYHGMKKKKLVALCAQEKLSTQGTEQELKNRHMEFLTLYNAECDAQNPRSHAELAKLMEDREKRRREEKQLALQSGCMSHSTLVNRLVQSSHQGTLPVNEDQTKEQERSKITSGNTEFDEKMKLNFRQLIENERKRQGKSKTVVKNTYGTSTSTLSSPSSSQAKKNNVTDNVDGNHDNNETSASKLPIHTTSDTRTSYKAISPSRTNPTFQQRTSVPLPPSQQPSPFRNSSQTSSTSPISSVSPSFSRTGPWTCTTCTFINKTRYWPNASCEMCGSKRTAAVNGAPIDSSVTTIDV